MAEPIAFSLELLAGAATHRPAPISVRPAGHLVVNGTGCLAPVRFAADLHAIYCQRVDCNQAGGP